MASWPKPSTPSFTIILFQRSPASPQNSATSMKSCSRASSPLGSHSLPYLSPQHTTRSCPNFKALSKGAVESCTGHGNNTCSDRWYMSQYDGWTGMEEEIAMSNIYLANMIQFEGLAGPVTSRTGDNSTSNVNAGKGYQNSNHKKAKPITTGYLSDWCWPCDFYFRCWMGWWYGVDNYWCLVHWIFSWSILYWHLFSRTGVGCFRGFFLDILALWKLIIFSISKTGSKLPWELRSPCVCRMTTLSWICWANIVSFEKRNQKG